MLYALMRCGFAGEMTGHGFRAIASTVLHESGLFRREAIELQLAHLKGDKTEKAYNRAEYLEERQAHYGWWGAFLAKRGLTLPDGARRVATGEMAVPPPVRRRKILILNNNVGWALRCTPHSALQFFLAVLGRTCSGASHRQVVSRFDTGSSCDRRLTQDTPAAG